MRKPKPKIQTVAKVAKAFNKPPPKKVTPPPSQPPSKPPSRKPSKPVTPPPPPPPEPEPEPVPEKDPDPYFVTEEYPVSFKTTVQIFQQ